ERQRAYQTQVGGRQGVLHLKPQPSRAEVHHQLGGGQHHQHEDPLEVAAVEVRPRDVQQRDRVEPDPAPASLAVGEVAIQVQRLERVREDGGAVEEPGGADVEHQDEAQVHQGTVGPQLAAGAVQRRTGREDDARLEEDEAVDAGGRVDEIEQDAAEPFVGDV